MIGAQKCGTTSLFEYLRRHPGLVLPRAKEWAYFSNDAHFQARGWSDYLGELFTGADPNAKWGTVTPQYMAGGIAHEAASTISPDSGNTERIIPLRIREQLPDVRLIALLRDPVPRAWSHYRHAVLQGLEHRTFADAIDSALEPSALDAARRRPDEVAGYVAWGEYGRILEAYAAVFPRDQLLVLFTEELERSPAQLLRRVYDFVGAAPDVVSSNLDVRYLEGATALRVPALGKGSRFSPWGLQRAAARSGVARRIWHLMRPRRRYQLELAFQRVAYSLDLWNRRPEVDYPPEDVADRLRAHFAADGARLIAALDVLPPWMADAGGSA